MSLPEQPRSTTRPATQGLPRRRALALFAGLGLLAGCGFTPAYGPGGAGTKLQGQVSLPDPGDADQFALNARLEERLGPANAPAYALSYDLTLAATSQVTGFDKVVSRYALNGTVDYRLTEAATGQVVAEGQVSSFAAYDTGPNTVTGLTDAADARARLMGMLADQLVTRLLAAPL